MLFDSQTNGRNHSKHTICKRNSVNLRGGSVAVSRSEYIVATMVQMSVRNVLEFKPHHRGSLGQSPNQHRHAAPTAPKSRSFPKALQRQDTDFTMGTKRGLNLHPPKGGASHATRLEEILK